ncbi:MAG TPA: ABC transporter ATP-binding protein [Thermodesulfobacteriota bacterium]
MTVLPRLDPETSIPAFADSGAGQPCYTSRVPLEPAVSVRDVSKVYLTGDLRVEAVRGVSLDVAPGTFLALVGPSGCGKSTLLNLIGALDRPSRGDVVVGGVSLGALDDDGLTRYRRQTVGFVFQFFNLLPSLTVAENVALPMQIDGRPAAAVRERVARLLEEVGLAHRAGHRPAQLSGGEQQRVAVARALANDPPLLLGDEPTGNLDTRASAALTALFAGLARDGRRTVILATHSPEVAAAADRVVRMRDGEVVEDAAAVAR